VYANTKGARKRREQRYRMMSGLTVISRTLNCRTSLGADRLAATQAVPHPHSSMRLRVDQRWRILFPLYLTFVDQA
jgi:hypothetical protein